MEKKLLLILLIAPLLTLAQLTQKSVSNPNGPIGFYEFKPQGYNPDSTYQYPLIIFLSGVGERGNGTTELPRVLTSSFAKILDRGATMKFTVNGRQHAFLVLIPQLSEQYINWQNFYVDAMIDYAISNLKIDQNKIFLTGWSLGGGGAWKYPTASIDSANRIAGTIPVSPAPDYTNLCNIAQGKVAVWAHHARDDLSIPLHYTVDAVNAINACPPIIPALITIYDSGGHGFVADAAYDTLNNYQYPNMFQWMIGTTRSNTSATNQPPIAIAGNDTTIIIPSTQGVLNGAGSNDPNDVIVKYQWAFIAGPSSPLLSIEKPNFPVTNVSGLEPGNYTFRLTVTDQFEIVRTDDVNLLVSGAVPLDMLYYKGKNVGQTNVLTWGTHNEVNFDHFEILRSKDGSDFFYIGKVTLGQNSSTGKDYSFSDAKAPKGLNYYRLKQVDKDGSFKLSPIVSINNNNKPFLVVAYPNPVKEKLNLILEGSIYGNIKITINDMQGRLLDKQNITKDQFMWKGTMNVQHLGKGLYSIWIKTADDILQMSTFLKQ